MAETTPNPLTRAEFEQLSPAERNEHVQEALTALRRSVPKSGAAAGAFIDARLYVQELAGWAPTEVESLWPLHRAGIESHAGEIHAAFQEALDSGSLSPAQSEFARAAVQADGRIIGPADEYL
jgi:hypothetical protein